MAFSAEFKFPNTTNIDALQKEDNSQRKADATELGVTVRGRLVKPEAVIRGVLMKPEAVTRADYQNRNQIPCTKVK